MKRVDPSAVVASVRNHGDLVIDDQQRSWFIPHLPADTAPDPDQWPAPLLINSPMFTGWLATKFPMLPSSPKLRREYVDAIAGAAFGGRTLPALGWSALVPAHMTATRTLAYCVHPSWVLLISPPAQHGAPPVVRPVRNGIDFIAEPPGRFAPILWADLKQHWPRGIMPDGTGTEPGYMPSLYRAVVGSLPPPVDTESPDAPAVHDAQQCYVLAWWMGLFIGPLTPQGRPMLSLVGEPGCGKTVTASLLGRAFYGEDFAVGGGVGGGRAVKDLVAYLVYKPVAIADDQNDLPPEIVDTLCRIATGANVELAAMHQTLELASFKAQASVALTANRPAWALRDDLLERMLPVLLGKPEESDVTEDDRVQVVVHARTRIFAETLCAVAQAMRSERRWHSSTRFQSWELWIRRCAQAGGWLPHIDQALRMVKAQRVRLACWADPWVYVLWSIAYAMKDDPRNLTASEIYDTFVARFAGVVTEDRETRPSTRAMNNPMSIGRFLERVERQGSAAVLVKRGPLRNGIATWCLYPKDVPLPA